MEANSRRTKITAINTAQLSNLKGQANLSQFKIRIELKFKIFFYLCQILTFNANLSKIQAKSISLPYFVEFRMSKGQLLNVGGFALSNYEHLTINKKTVIDIQFFKRKGIKRVNN